MLNEKEFSRIESLFFGPGGEAARVYGSLRNRFQPVLDAYRELTGVQYEHRWDGTPPYPKGVLHHRLAYFGPPCPYCRRFLRNKNAKQCFECGMDWHDPSRVVNRKLNRSSSADSPQ